MKLREFANIILVDKRQSQVSNRSLFDVKTLPAQEPGNQHATHQIWKTWLGWLSLSKEKPVLLPPCSSTTHTHCLLNLGCFSLNVIITDLCASRP